MHVSKLNKNPKRYASIFRQKAILQSDRRKLNQRKQNMVKKKKVWAASPAAMLDRCARPRRRGANGVLVLRIDCGAARCSIRDRHRARGGRLLLSIQHSALGFSIDWFTAKLLLLISDSHHLWRHPLDFRLHYLIYHVIFIFYKLNPA